MLHHPHKLINMLDCRHRSYSRNKKKLLLSVTSIIAIAIIISFYTIWGHKKQLQLQHDTYIQLQYKYRQIILKELNFLPSNVALHKVDALHKDLAHSKNRL